MDKNIIMGVALASPVSFFILLALAIVVIHLEDRSWDVGNPLRYLWRVLTWPKVVWAAAKRRQNVQECELAEFATQYLWCVFIPIVTWLARTDTVLRAWMTGLAYLLLGAVWEFIVHRHHLKRPV